MASDLNTVAVCGRLTKDPETRDAAGTTVTELRVAVNNSRKTANGWEDQPGFYNVAVWGAQGEAAQKFLSKGSQVAVQGRLAWREWEQDGKRRESISITASQVQFVGARQGDSTTPTNTDGDIPF